MGDSLTMEGVSVSSYSIITKPKQHTLLTSRTLPLTGLKALEAALTVSTEEKDSLNINNTEQHHTQP